MNTPLHTLFAERELDLDTLCRLAGVDTLWLQSHLSLLHPAGSDAWLLARVRRLVWLEREFDAVPELAALVVDLEEELRRLRSG